MRPLAYKKSQCIESSIDDWIGVQVLLHPDLNTRVYLMHINRYCEVSTETFA